MSPTFEIFKYTDAYQADSKPLLKITDLNISGAEANLSWTGTIGENGQYMLEQLTRCALENGIAGPVKETFGTFLDYARKNFVHEDQTAAQIHFKKEFSNDSKVIPRPHHDGCFRNPKLNSKDAITGKIRDPYKIGTVFIGPGTVFWDVGDLSDSDKIDEGKQKHKNGKEPMNVIAVGLWKKKREVLGLDNIYNVSTEVNRWAQTELEKFDIPIVSPKLGEGVKWIICNGERAAIHSEPDLSDMPQGRIYISYLPGTEEQIGDVARRFDQEFREPPEAAAASAL